MTQFNELCVPLGYDDKYYCPMNPENPGESCINIGRDKSVTANCLDHVDGDQLYHMAFAKDRELEVRPPGDIVLSVSVHQDPGLTSSSSLARVGS